MATKTFRGVTYTEKTALTNNSSLFGTIGNDWLVTKGGNNTVFASEGKNVILAGVTFTGVKAYEPLGPDYPTDYLFDKNSFFKADTIDYTFLPNAGNMTVYCGAGDDYVITGKGNDIVFLGEGNNTYDSTGGSGFGLFDFYNSPAGGLGFTGNDIIYAGSGNDIIATGTGNDVIYAGEGNNRIQANAGNNIIYAGAGNDNILTASGDDLIFAGEGNNNIVGSGGSDTVYLGGGNDQLQFNYYADGSDPLRIDKKIIYAGEGNNSMFTNYYGVAATFIYYGGAGDDAVSVDASTNNIFYLGEGENNFSQYGNGSAVVYTGGNNDYFQLYNGQKTIYAGGGNNLFEIFAYGGGSIVGDNTVYIGTGVSSFLSQIGEGVTTVYGATSDEIFEIIPENFGQGAQASILIQQIGNDTLIGSQLDPSVYLLKNTIASNITAKYYDYSGF
jgi:Ca2+-binding RTX toxin-like protein